MEDIKDRVAKLAEVQKMLEQREKLAEIFFMFDQETQKYFMSGRYYKEYDRAKLRVKLSDTLVFLR